MSAQGTPAGAPHRTETTLDRAKPIALGLILAVFAVIGLWLLVELRQVLVLIFVAVLFASAIARPAAMLERRGMPRGLAVVIVQLVVMVVLLALIWVVVPPLVDQLARFSRDAPGYVTRSQHVRDEYLAIKRQYPEVATFDAQVAALGGRVAGSVGEQLVNVPLTMAKLLFDLAMIYVIATLLVLRRERLLDGFLAARRPCAPRPHERCDGEDLGPARRVPAGEGGRHGLRRPPDVRRPAGARCPVRRPAVRDRRVRGADPQDRRLDRTHPAPRSWPPSAAAG